ncbi:splicing factor 3B subunit 3-like [Melia azedarach]|uniref:Splicing factor 3B subunit 3-like n=1 Tax=Melia azedarach TaxID=155640 RepID=A0ACC1XFS8_MELAZ|nr:splicing factor 3B subunit 3-like [Melia azedarach]
MQPVFWRRWKIVMMRIKIIPSLVNIMVFQRQNSCIRVLDPRTANMTCLLQLQDNEDTISICTVNFDDKEYATLLAVGTSKGLQFWPKRNRLAGYIHIYRFLEDGKSLELLRKTQVQGVPLALCEFQERLLAGIGSVLRLYNLGKKRLLAECENKLFPCLSQLSPSMIKSMLVTIKSQSISASIDRMRIDSTFADDFYETALRVDFDTMAGTDKFGLIE